MVTLLNVTTAEDSMVPPDEGMVVPHSSFPSRQPLRECEPLGFHPDILARGGKVEFLQC